MNNITIREKLPFDYKYGAPLYYCSEDDTLQTSRIACEYHAKRWQIKHLSQIVSEFREIAAESHRQIQLCKMKTLPQMQKSINDINAKLSKLIANKDWKSTHSTHAAKRREILELRYRKMFIVGELKKEILKLDGLRQKYKTAKQKIAEYEEAIEQKQRELKDIDKRWKKEIEEKKA